MKLLLKLIIIVGPTASGKTALGIEVAKRVGGEIISADSRLVYRGMDIGTAKPTRDLSAEPHPNLPLERGGDTMRDLPIFKGASPVGNYMARPREQEGVTGAGQPHLIPPLERGGNTLLSPTPPHLPLERGGHVRYMVEGIPHWGIDLVNPDEEYNVSQFKAYAEEKILEISRRSRIPIFVGGTGLWVDAVVDNISIPEVPPIPEIRAELESRTLEELYEEYKRLDPVGAEAIDYRNKRRLVRAIEVCRVTRKPFSELRVKGKPLYEALKIGIDVPKDVLNERINHRVDEMIAKGLVDEVRLLFNTYGSGAVAMTGIGYRQIVNFLEGKIFLVSAIEDVKRDTRAYAKRQMTWFKRDARIHWIQNSAQAWPFVEMFFKKTPLASSL